jgi:hypothetical protein
MVHICTFVTNARKQRGYVKPNTAVGTTAVYLYAVSLSVYSLHSILGTGPAYVSRRLLRAFIITEIILCQGHFRNNALKQTEVTSFPFILNSLAIVIASSVVQFHSTNTADTAESNKFTLPIRSFRFSGRCFSCRL